MTIERFIEDNRAQVDEFIHAALDGYAPYDDEDRELCLVNHEGLWNWLIDEGVDVYGEDDE